jgi:DNA-binding response OmpR family regulator
MTKMERKILITDDDNGICLMIQRLLELKGFSVIIAADGAECLRQADEHKPDLILLDMGMPQVGGMSALANLKDNPALSHIPVIVVTGDISSEKTQHAAKLGADDYLMKPFKSDELLARIAKHLVRMDYTGLKGALLDAGIPDRGLSQLASHAGDKAWDVYVTEFRDVAIRILAPRGFDPKTIRNLPEETAFDKLVVLANMGFSWKRLWPPTADDRMASRRLKIAG